MKKKNNKMKKKRNIKLQAKQTHNSSKTEVKQRKNGINTRNIQHKL